MLDQAGNFMTLNFDLQACKTIKSIFLYLIIWTVFDNQIETNSA